MRRVILLLFVALVLCASAWGQGNVRVMTLGLRSLPQATNPVARDYQDDALRSVLMVEHPDIVGLQDINERMANHVRTHLTNYKMVGDRLDAEGATGASVRAGGASGQQGAESAMCILFAVRTFELVEWGSVDEAAPFCIWAVLTHKASGGRVLVLSGRLADDGARTARGCSRLLAERIGALRERFQTGGEPLPTFLALDDEGTEADASGTGAGGLGRSRFGGFRRAEGTALSVLIAPQLSTMGFSGLSPLLHDACASVSLSASSAIEGTASAAVSPVPSSASPAAEGAASPVPPRAVRARRPGARSLASASEGSATGRVLFRDASPVEYVLPHSNYGAVSVDGCRPAVFTARLWSRRQPQRILIVGTQLTSDIADGYIADIAREAGHSVTIGHLSIADASLEDHARSARLMERRYEYRKYRDGRAVTARKASTLIGGLDDDDWDVVVLQQSMPRSGRAASYEPFLSALLDSVRHHCPTAALGLQQPWAYSPDAKQAGFALYGNSQRVMYESIVEATCEVAARHYFDYLILTGAAIQMARTRYGDVFVRRSDSFTRDGERLTERAGRYLAALVWAETVLGIDVRSTAFAPHGIKAAYAALLRECAHDAAR